MIVKTQYIQHWENVLLILSKAREADFALTNLNPLSVKFSLKS